MHDYMHNASHDSPCDHVFRAQNFSGLVLARSAPELVFSVQGKPRATVGRKAKGSRLELETAQPPGSDWRGMLCPCWPLSGFLLWECESKAAFAFGGADAAGPARGHSDRADDCPHAL